MWLHLATPQPRIDMHVCGLQVVLLEDQAAVLPRLHFQESVAKCYHVQ